MAATVNLRSFPSPKQLICPHCAKPLTLYDPDGSEYLVCSLCNSYLRYVNKDHLQTQKSVSPIKYEHVVEVGAEGMLKGTPYKVLAYMEKKESDTNYEWREYMLYSYTKGYAFLAEYNGHWTFIAGIQHFPDLANVTLEGSAANLNRVDYLEYNRYSPVITALKGEFDWDVYGERISAREFVYPPYMLVREKNKTNEQIIDWYLGEYIEPREIMDAFKVTSKNFPERVDIGAIQPNPNKKRWEQSLRISIAAAVIMVMIQMLFSVLRPSQTLISRSVVLALPPPKIDTAKRIITKSDSAARRDSSLNAAVAASSSPVNGNYEFQPAKTESFTIQNGPAPVNIQLSAPVDNNWFEATVELVSEKDNQTWDITEEIEYYHGYEDGESWSEGSNIGSVVVDDIPPGKYHINIYPYAGTQLMGDIEVMVTANVILWQNLVVTFLLLCIAPLCFWYFQRRYEVSRWMDSDFSPYKKTTSSDD